LDVITCHQPETATIANGQAFCLYGQGLVTEVRLQSAWQTYLAGNLLLLVAVTVISRGWWQPPQTHNDHISRVRAMVRFLTVYLSGAATVCIWHGIWYVIDYLLLTDDILASGWTSAVAGAAVCLGLCAGASLVAPPGMFLMDGPSRAPPPFTRTIGTSYRRTTCPVSALNNKDQTNPFWLVVVDVFMSYLVLPWGVVSFWRGTWLLMDLYLWGSPFGEADLHRSILYGAIIAGVCLVVASENVVQYIYIPNQLHSNPTVHKIGNHILGQVRSLVLAVGAVNFWRSVWYCWDEFIGQSHAWSIAVSISIGRTPATVHTDPLSFLLLLT
jgi:hypothetical protein